MLQIKRFLQENLILIFATVNQPKIFLKIYSIGELFFVIPLSSSKRDFALIF